VGADADLTIIDPEPESTITVSDHKGIAGWTLYEGWKARGRPWMTLLRGETLLDRGRLERRPGYGQFLRRGGPMAPLGGASR
jgi:dihydroorotase-like cyclic amidohydrolase